MIMALVEVCPCSLVTQDTLQKGPLPSHPDDLRTAGSIAEGEKVNKLSFRTRDIVLWDNRVARWGSGAWAIDRAKMAAQPDRGRARCLASQGFAQGFGGSFLPVREKGGGSSYWSLAAGGGRMPNVTAMWAQI
jgi:hypothetical protein